MKHKNRVVGLIISLGLGLLFSALWLLSLAPMPAAQAASYITVNTTVDELDGGGNCSLREAISATNSDTAVGGCPAGSGADVIVLGANTYVLTRAGVKENSNNTGDLDITDALTITGAGPGSTIIDAGSIDRVLDIQYGVSRVVISGVTIYNGYVDNEDGGGIYNGDAIVTLINTEVLSNTAYLASGSTAGGGIYHNAGALQLINCAVLSNTTEGYGGGLYVYLGTATLSDTRFAYNAVNDTTGYRGGGGLYIHSGQISMAGGEIVSNTVAYNGGGVYVRESTAGFTQTGDTLIAYNSAGSSGGGLYVGTGSAATLGAAEVLSNTAWVGGGLCVNGGDVTLSATRIISNAASPGGGGGISVNPGSTMTMQSVHVLGNVAGTNGGGVFNSGLASIETSALIGNHADDAGGILNYGVMTVTNSTLSGNIADDLDGGGVYNQTSGVLTLIHTTILSNTASRYGAGVMALGGTVNLRNSIVADNASANCYGTLTSLGNNLEDTDTCGLSVASDITDTAAGVGALMTMSGTLVHPLLPGSAAINAGACIAGITVDQRGAARPEGPACDIGAFEFNLETVYLPLVLRNQ